MNLNRPDGLIRDMGCSVSVNVPVIKKDLDV